ncbi:hypothetical protein GM415_05865 [Pseudodesulfovibrio cashew]|uniref:Peptidase U32 n=1 Tax=Pseudodesulfovibrio cashew TaxID=2678688 RepID=A0A6I6JH27_9BACT|nr:hypothetical protein [Pseudodesulfovibrio cashew]QGY39662.1 hypothetical protein GM415_05865 [Pseudodesulfovibrio cashew]
MQLDVPFLPDSGYAEFLAERTGRLASVHFSLFDPALADARPRMERHAPEDLARALKPLDGVPKFVLLNTRLHRPEAYFSAEVLAAAAARLDYLADEAGIQGLIFADPYYLQALSDAHPGVAEKLEAVISINAMPDSPRRIFAMLDMIAGTAFRQPSRLVLDRSLNRDFNRLRDTVREIRKLYSGMRFLLMANEGCLPACPYKPAHDAHLAMSVAGLCRDRTFAINHDLGCIRRFLDDPGLLLASPFIRPEDMGRYCDIVDGIKLCGRTRGADFLGRAVDAYLEGHYPGNLLDLMDAMGDLADRIDLPNASIPLEFFEKTAQCSGACRACGWCASLADSLICRKEPKLPHLSELSDKPSRR